jgi:hypothetical protein
VSGAPAAREGRPWWLLFRLGWGSVGLVRRTASYGRVRGGWRRVLLGLQLARNRSSPRPGAGMPAGGAVGVGGGGLARREGAAAPLKGTREQEHGRGAARAGEDDRAAPVRRRAGRAYGAATFQGTVRGGARRSRRLGAGAALGRHEASRGLSLLSFSKLRLLPSP